MQALEMESEVERLVGPSAGAGARLKLNQKPSKSGTWWCATLVQSRNFLVKVVGVAFLAMILLMAMSAGKDYKKNESSDSVGVVEKPIDPSPVAPAPLTPVQEPKPNTKVEPKPAPTSTNNVVDKNPDETKKGGPPLLYSKYATVVPIPGEEPLEDAKKKEMIDHWGNWHFWDGDENMRPTKEYTSKYPNMDIPGDDFPQDAWQADAVFVNHILNEADQLISRAMEAIFSEYGHGKPLPIAKLAERMKMFHWDKIDMANSKGPPQQFTKRGDRGIGGWTTGRSFDGLVRRLLHAMMTSDTFTVVMGGHSAAAGQGNHFRQNYMMQFHKIMYPIFARLGVKLITRNIGQGGIGTVQGSMGSGSIYGGEVDMLFWDSGMTENGSKEHIDLFIRQGLLGGNRVPIIWGNFGEGNFDLLKMLHEHADVDVGEWGSGKDGIIEATSEEHAKEIPYAARYMKCKPSVKWLCDKEPRFCASCWIDREDGITPEQKQLVRPKGQVKWHPGWRDHLLQGRVLAFSVMEALQAAINRWSEGTMGGPPLDDEKWHITSYYENIRNKVKNLDKSLGACYKIEGTLPTRMCNTPMQVRADGGLAHLENMYHHYDVFLTKTITGAVLSM
jgi:hypothetical protein